MAELPGPTLATILVVDDVSIVLKLVVKILQASNFFVLGAASGPAAMTLADAYTGAIDLLLSDIHMPGMSGPDLGEALKRSRPDMRVMFMSGFVGGDLLVLNYGWAFIQKPFVPVKLVAMVKSILTSPDKSQGERQFDSRKSPQEE
jgi:two-component system, cell cycle sensor histidine kinase and response regulator CckA